MIEQNIDLFVEAVYKNDFETAKTILNNGFDINSGSYYGVNTKEQFDFILENGFDITAKDKYLGINLFENSVYKNDFETAKYLLNKGLNINSRESYNINTKEQFDFILENGFNNTEKSYFGIGLFRDAIRENNFEMAKYLISKGVNINCGTFSPQTKEKLDFLLENGYNINTKDISGANLLTGNIPIEVFKYALEKGASPSMTYNMRYLATSYMFEDIEKIKLLLEYGADVGMKNSEGQNMLDVLREFIEMRKEAINNNQKRLENLEKAEKMILEKKNEPKVLDNKQVINNIIKLLQQLKSN